MNDNEDASRMMDHLLFGIDRRVGSVLIYAIEGPEITLSAPESGLTTIFRLGNPEPRECLESSVFSSLPCVVARAGSRS
ncbi:predicted protein [Chaetomium globosum CBS 148.51]|uniref:Uncharacterized protein n=1 Tax=Chaetomium globosum (strain ATCC 6205 / CBS 148.51 / DSM 1962 / NBRC 6347 / NRRL 1970) TaxID=306901 RepID=Q2GX77_CHAGB|nr:uncharacterized protein CHGG_07427 [Chaetomium globosum CBS 148.51]EAQ86174.1 predicted protein [Chaetomium globosum CBS 148.51]